MCCSPEVVRPKWSLVGEAVAAAASCQWVTGVLRVTQMSVRRVHEDW